MHDFLTLAEVKTCDITLTGQLDISLPAAFLSVPLRVSAKHCERLIRCF